MPDILSRPSLLPLEAAPSLRVVLVGLTMKVTYAAHGRERLSRGACDLQLAGPTVVYVSFQPWWVVLGMGHRDASLGLFYQI